MPSLGCLRSTQYGELLVNEFPMVPGATNPRLFALPLGSRQAVPSWDVLAEYTYVTESAYSNNNRTQPIPSETNL